MSIVKKVENFWFYYKIHILVGVFILAVVVPMVGFDKEQKPSALNVSLLGNGINPKYQEQLQNEATNSILGKGAKSEIKLNFWQVDGQIRSMSNIDLYQKLLAQIGAKKLDVLILDKSDFDLMVKEDAFIPLNSTMSNNGIGEGTKLGIDLTGNKILSKAGYNTENKVVCILKNSKAKETAMKFVEWLQKQ